MTKARKRQSSEQDGGIAQDAAEAPFHVLEDLLAYRFRNPQLLALALTHRSYAYEARHGGSVSGLDSREHRNPPGTDNEQLEFVGDAVLGLAITEAIYREFPQCTEGELTRLRSSLVSRKRMAELGLEIGLGDHLRLGRSAEQNGGRRKPALLANAAEALMAAIYLDARQAGEDGLAAVSSIADRLLVQRDLETMRTAIAADSGHGAMRDHKTLLQERVQAETAGQLRYVDTGQTGPAHQRRFSVEAQLATEDGILVLSAAEGSSKKEAQQRAAELALASWDPKFSAKNGKRSKTTETLSPSEDAA